MHSIQTFCFIDEFLKKNGDLRILDFSFHDKKKTLQSFFLFENYEKLALCYFLHPALSKRFGYVLTFLVISFLSSSNFLFSHS